MQKKLHILFLSSWYPSKVFPTNGDFVQRHAEAVATKHHVTIIHVVTDKNSKGPAIVTESTINNVRTIIIYVAETTNIILKFFRFFKTYINAIKNIGLFDIVHVNITFPVGIIAIYLKWFKGKKFIISEHWTGYQKVKSNTIGILEKYISKLIVKEASYVCPVTTQLKVQMINFGLKGNYFPIPNVVNTELFKPIYKIDDFFTISHISNMKDELKNITGILNVISKLELKIPNLKFNLIGNNSKNYELLIKRLKIKNVSIIDQISHNEVANYLKRTDTFLLFSNFENLPCVILEAFACGVPVISTNVGGISEYFPENFGYLTNPKDELMLENAILKVYFKKLKFNKSEMYKYAHTNFGITKICNLFSKLYLKTLKID